MNDPAPTPYRVLATGIPLNMSPESFYDHLRAYTSVGSSSPPSSLVLNALLLRVPATATSATSPTPTPPTDVATTAVAASQRPRGHSAEDNGDSGEAERGWVGTGAALVDFVSKHAAEAVLALPCAPVGGLSFMLPTAPPLPDREDHHPPGTRGAGGSAGARKRERVGDEGGRAVAVTWQMLGPVEAAPGSTAAAMRHTHETQRRKGMCAYAKEAWQPSCNDSEAVCNKEEEGEVARAKTEEPLSIALPTDTSVELCLESGDLPDLFGPLWLPRSATTPSPLQATPATMAMARPAEVDLFSIFEDYLRRKLLLPGSVHALRRLSDTRVLLTTDADTASHLTHSSSHPQGAFTMRVNPELAASIRDMWQGNDNGPHQPLLLHWRHVRGVSSSSHAVPVDQLMRQGNDKTRTADDESGNAPEPLAAASMADVMAAMSRVLAHTGGSTGAFADCYGNVVFPSGLPR